MVRFGVMEIDNSSYFNVQSNNNNLEFYYIKFVYLDGYLLDRLSQTCTRIDTFCEMACTISQKELGEGSDQMRILGGEII